MSHGSLLQDGSDVRYELRMPLAEVPDDPDRARLLLSVFQIIDGGQPVSQANAKCSEEAGQGLFICSAT